MKQSNLSVDSQLNDPKWLSIYGLGGICAIIAFILTLTDIVFGSITSANLTELPETAIERFMEFQDSTMMGLYHLDLLNLIIAIVMIPTFFALVSIHRKSNLPFAVMTMLIFLIATTIFVASNAAMPMLGLSSQYLVSSDPDQKIFFAAAGEAILAKGAHGSYGVFIGFALSTVANICVSLLMLQGKIFSKATAYLGVIGYVLLLIYILLVTFAPSTKSIAVMIAAPGGIMAVVWLFVVGRRLIKKSRHSIT